MRSCASRALLQFVRICESRNPRGKFAKLVHRRCDLLVQARVLIGLHPDAFTSICRREYFSVPERYIAFSRFTTTVAHHLRPSLNDFSDGTSSRVTPSRRGSHNDWSLHNPAGYRMSNDIFTAVQVGRSWSPPMQLRCINGITSNIRDGPGYYPQATPAVTIIGTLSMCSIVWPKVHKEKRLGVGGCESRCC